MKHLLRERERQSLTWGQRFKQALSRLPKIAKKPDTPNEDSVSGLSPDTLTTLRRVQGDLGLEWMAARPVPLNPVNGKVSRWVKANVTEASVARPRVRIQLRRLENPEQGKREQNRKSVSKHDLDSGLDDIFPERITGFFQEKASRQTTQPRQPKSRSKSQKKEEKKNSVVVDYQVMMPKKRKSAPLGGAALSKVHWPITRTLKTSLNRVVAASKHQPPQWVEKTEPQVQPIQPASVVASAKQEEAWPNALKAMLAAQLNDFISRKNAPVDAALPAQPEKTPVEREVPKPVELAEPEFERLSFSDADATGNVRTIQPDVEPILPTPEEPVAEDQPVPVDPEPSLRVIMPKPMAIPHPRPGKSLSGISKPKSFAPPAKPNIQDVFQQTMRELAPHAVVAAEIKKMRIKSEQAYRSHREQQVVQYADSLEYMVRNNRILTRSISNLTERYFQQAALEEAQAQAEAQRRV